MCLGKSHFFACAVCHGKKEWEKEEKGKGARMA
jgi:hypothetical protein